MESLYPNLKKVGAVMIANLTDRPLTILATYNGVMKDPNIFILHLILDTPNIREQLEGYFDIRKFECQSEGRIQTLLLNRDKKNILEWAALKKFDFEFNYEKMFEKFPRMYLDSPPLKMLSAFQKLIEEKFTRKIYFYDRKKDRRVMYDIVSNFAKNNKIEYVYGSYLDVVSAIGGIDLFIDSDIDRLAPVMYMPEYWNSTFLIAQYGYNYVLNENNRPMLKNDIAAYAAKKDINLLEFVPYEITAESIANG